MWGLRLLLWGLLSFGTCLSSAIDGRQQDRPGADDGPLELHSAPGSLGECPKPQGAGLCVEMCSSDDICGPGQRCCSNGCGHECTDVMKDFCRLPRSVGSDCSAASSLRVAYNSRAGLCEKFIYKGCGGNGNNFATQLECLRTCSSPSICQLPVNQGFGDAFRTRFYYNGASKTCERFLYAGHGGNANNFWEKEACLRFCARHEA